MSEKTSIDFKALDSLRGLAALYVLIHHARLVLTQSYQEGFLKHPEAYNLLDKSMVYSFGIFKWGHQAVLLFFVLSGFVIHLQQVKNEGKIFSTKQYLIKRTIRIYPTLLFAFLLSFCLDALYAYISGTKNYLSSIYSIRLLIENILLIPDSGAWGLNYPVWSLKHEWIFYLIYPILYFFSKRGIAYSLIIPISFFLLFLFNFKIPYLGSSMYTILIWWIGMFLAEIYIKKRAAVLAIFRWSIPIGILLLLTPLSSNILFFDLFWGFIFAGFILFILNQKNKTITIILLYSSFWGEISYSLYLYHSPILTFLRKIYFMIDGNNQLPHHYWLVLFGVSITIPSVYLMYLAIEKPFKSLKNILFHK